jgi:chromosome segregation ATPase
MEIFLAEYKPIKFLGRVTSCNLINSENPKKYDIGIVFLDMSEEDRKKLKKYIQDLELFKAPLIMSNETEEVINEEMEETAETEHSVTEKIKDSLEVKLAELERSLELPENDLFRSAQEGNRLMALLKQRKAIELKAEKTTFDEKATELNKEKEELEDRLAELKTKAQFTEEDLSKIIEDKEKLRLLWEKEKEKTEQLQSRIHEFKEKEAEFNALPAKLEEKDKSIGEEVPLSYGENVLPVEKKETSSKEINMSISTRFLYIIVIPSLFLLSMICILFIFLFLAPEKQRILTQPLETEQKNFTKINNGPFHTLELVAEDTTWIFVKIDDKESKETILKPGERIKMQAKSNFSLTIGNAGGAKVIFDGKNIGPIGAKGQVVKLKIPSPKIQGKFNTNK